MLVCVDVFFPFSVRCSTKKKETSTVIEAVEEVLDITEPTIKYDTGSEFISNSFKRFVKERGIDVQFSLSVWFLSEMLSQDHNTVFSFSGIHSF